MLLGIRWGGLRTKIIAWSFVPTVIILVAVAWVTFSAYQQVTEDLVIVRNQELTRFATGEFAAGLTEYTRLLTEYAGLLGALPPSAYAYEGDLAVQSDVLRRARSRFEVFDGGVLVISSHGTVLAAEPERPEILGQDWSDRPYFQQVLSSLGPVFSNIVDDGPEGAEVIVVSMPIKGDQGQFLGIMTGMFHLGATAANPFYSDLMELRLGESGSTYLVDGQGQVVYHPDLERIGSDFSSHEAVQRVLKGEVGAILTQTLDDQEIVASFAPVPGTPWGLVSGESWATLISPIQGPQRFLLLLLALGVVVPALVVYIGARRLTSPIAELISAAQEVAGGNFGYTITAQTGDEIEDLAEQFNLMAAQLQESYAYLEQRVADRTKELAALNIVAQTVSQSLELEAMLTAALDKVLDVLGFDSGAIYLKNLRTNELQMICHCGLSEAFRHAVNKGLISATVAESGQPIILDDLSEEPNTPREVTDEGYLSVASIPLLFKGQVRGVLTAASREVHRFRQQDVELLLSIGHQIGVAVENARLFDAVQRRAEQFKVISEVGRHITSILAVDELLDQLVVLLQQTLNYDTVEIALIEGDELVFKARARPDLAAPFEGFRLKVGEEGITGWVAATGKPIFVPDVNQDPRYIQMAETVSRSELAVPIKTKEKVIGVLNVQSEKLDAFDESDLVVTQSIADQAAIAIENARLFETEERRAEQFRVISEVGRQITSILNVNELLKRIVHLVTETLGYHQAAIGLVEGDELVFRAAAGRFWEGLESQPLRLKVGQEGITGWVAHSGEPLLVRDVSREPRYYRVPGDIKTQSELAVPLKLALRPTEATKDAIIGVLAVSSDHLDGFDETALAVLQSLAYQAAIAIENARLFETEERRAEQFRVISEVGRQITSILDTDRLLQHMVRLIGKTLGYHRVSIGLIEGNELIFKASAGVGWDPPPRGKHMRIKVGSGVTGRVAYTGEPLLVPDVSQEPLFIPTVVPTPSRSELAVPLKTKDAVIGVLNVESERLNAFDQSDVAVLQSLAHQAAVAIENVSFFKAEQRRAEQFRVISKVGRQITSILDETELLEEIVRLLKETFGYYLITIGLIEGEDVVFKAGSKTHWDEPQFLPPPTKLGGKGITARVAATGEPLLAPDVSKEPHFLFLTEAAETRSELAVPLKTKTANIGVLNVESDQLNAFDESDLTVLQTLAHQAAIAIENARLFRNTARQVRELRALAEASRIISSVLDQDQLLQSFYQQITRIAPTDFYLIALYDEATNVVSIEINVDEGIHYPKQQYVLEKGLLKIVIHDKQPLRFDSLVEAKPQLGVEIMPVGSPRVNHGWLGVPMLYGDRVVGALVVGSYQRAAFDEGHQQTLTSIANQAAVALENARLFTERERRIDEMAVLNEVGRAISSTLQLDELLDLIYHQVSRVMDATNLYIALYDKSKDWVSFPLYVSENQITRGGRGRKAARGLTEYIIRSRQPLLLPDNVDSRIRQMGIESIGTPAKSWLGVPMIAGDEVLGVIAVQSHTTENVYDEGHLNLLPTIAAQAAIAIENARLYEQARQLAVMEERQRLARELHDAVTQTLFSASLIAEALPTIWKSDQEEGQQLLQDLQQLSRGALAEMRTLLMELRPAALVEANLGDLLRQLGEAVAGRIGVPVTVAIKGQYDFPPDVHVALYRIAQEALNNVVKHAQANQVTVSLQCAPTSTAAPSPTGREWDRVELCISDDGRGFDPSSVPSEHGRLGLGIISERAEAIGAKLQLESQLGHGTKVLVVWERALGT